MLKVEITGDALEYILQKNADSITIDMVNYGGWGGNYWDPAVTAGKPLKPEKYDLVNANGLDVYVYKDAEAEPAGITIFTKPDPYEINWLRVSGLIYAQTDLG